LLSSGEPNGSLFLEPELNLISELQAPLLGIAANARVASDKLARDDARIVEYLEAIEFSSKNLVRTIDILLRSRDLETEGLALDIQPLHIGLRVEEAIEKLVPLCRVQAQVLSFKPNKNLLISANDDCLELIVYHVIEQALRSSASEEIITVQLASSGADAKLIVKAKGTRERASNLRKLLKRSVQLGEARKQLGGVNFSLVASARLLEAMGGSLFISQRCDGINFNLRFPLSCQGSLFG